MPSWARRVDKNQPEIVKKLRQCGCGVLLIHRVGDKAPDLVVGWMGVNYLLEVKSTKKQAGGVNKMAIHEAAQVNAHRAWPGLKPLVVRSFEEAWDALRGIKHGE